MNEDEFQSILVISYFLTEQGRFKEALHVLMLASENHGTTLEFNRVLITIFYLQKEYKKCCLLFRKHPSLVAEDNVFKKLELICARMNKENQQ